MNVDAKQGEVFVGRRYAGILGPLAFLTVVARGLMHHSGLESTMLSAAMALFGFAFVGYVVGQLAGWIVLDSVETKVAAELEAHDNKLPKAAAKHA